jgi:hypothetical protein
MLAREMLCTKKWPSSMKDQCDRKMIIAKILRLSRRKTNEMSICLATIAPSVRFYFVLLIDRFVNKSNLIGDICASLVPSISIAPAN